MAVATITRKGQTTIPREIRAYLRVYPGDKLGFLINAQGRVVLTSLTSDVRELKTLLPKPKKKVTLEQMNKAL